MGDPRVQAAARVALLFGLDPLVVLDADPVAWRIRAAAARVAAAELDEQERRRLAAMRR